MLGVKDLETKVVSTSLGIELHVWCPVKWDGLESGGDFDETQLIVVGLIKDVSNLRTEGGSKANADGEPSISYEVALFEELSVDHATRLDVARDQKFLVDCNKLWACPQARVMIVQYELFCFTVTGKWSPRVETTVDFQLLVTELQHKHADMTEDSEVRQIAEWWWWYVREKVRISMQTKAFHAKLCVLGVE